jgi:hypothetical protein
MVFLVTLCEDMMLNRPFLGRLSGEPSAAKRSAHDAGICRRFEHRALIDAECDMRHDHQ